MKKLFISIFISFASLYNVFAHGTNIAFKFTVGGNDLQLNTEYNIHGTRVKFSNVQFYISNFRFVKADSTEEVESVSACAVAGVDSMMHFHLSNVPHGSYTGLKFDIGLDSSTNHSDPAAYATNNPLSILNPHVAHWSWNSGYIFLVVEGLVDSSQAQNQSVDQLLEMHVGGDSYKTEIYIQQNFSISHSNDPGIQITLEMNELLHDLDLKLQTDRVTHTMDNMMLANHLKSHFSDAYEFEKLISSIYEIGNAADIKLTVFPNPAEDAAVILFDNPNNTRYQITVADLSGKRIFESSVADNRAEISLGNLASGMYLLNLVDENNNSYNTKFLVR